MTGNEAVKALKEGKELLSLGRLYSYEEGKGFKYRDAGEEWKSSNITEEKIKEIEWDVYKI